MASAVVRPPSAVDRRLSAVGRRPLANSRGPTALGRWPSANSRRSMADGVGGICKPLMLAMGNASCNLSARTREDPSLARSRLGPSPVWKCGNLESGNLGTWKSGNLGSNKIRKIQIIKIKICSAQNVGKVLISRKNPPDHFSCHFSTSFHEGGHDMAWTR